MVPPPHPARKRRASNRAEILSMKLPFKSRIGTCVSLLARRTAELKNSTVSLTNSEDSFPKPAYSQPRGN